MSTDFLLGHVQATLVVGKLQFVLHLLFLQVGHRNLKQDPLRIRNNSSSNSNNSNNMASHLRFRIHVYRRRWPDSLLCLRIRMLHRHRRFRFRLPQARITYHQLMKDLPHLAALGPLGVEHHPRVARDRRVVVEDMDMDIRILRELLRRIMSGGVHLVLETDLRHQLLLMHNPNHNPNYTQVIK